MSANNLNNQFAQDASRIEGEILDVQRETGRISALIEKDELPMGIGFNYVSLVHKRSGAVGGSGWVNVAAENGTTNNCLVTPGIVSPAQDSLTYGAQANAIQSADICFRDLYKAYDPDEQVAQILENFVAESVDIVEYRDKLAFFQNAGHCMIANETLTEDTTSTGTMPLTLPTTLPIQGFLDIIAQRLKQDGAGRQAYARSNGAPVFPLICSSAAHRAIIKEDASIRSDFHFAEEGKGDAATLMKGWGVDREFGGYMHIIDDKMPRWNWTGSAWVQVPFYIAVTSTIGNQLIVNPAYTSAGYEDMFIWNKKVVKRLMPKPVSSFGSKTSADPVKWNGDVEWVNERNLDPNSVAYNPRKDIGKYLANFEFAYRPGLTQYGYVIRCQIANQFALNPGYH